MALESEISRVIGGAKDTLKTLITKLGGTVSDELIDQYSGLAGSVTKPDKWDKGVLLDGGSLKDVNGNDIHADVQAALDIPAANDAKLTIQKNGTEVGTFSANASADKTIDITVPTKASDTGSVGYDAAQSLTDGQKTQARGNINAAPGGFGLGEATAHEMITDCDDAKLSGLYIMSSPTANSPPLIPNGRYSLLRVSARTSTEILQEVFCCGISGQYDFSAVRSYENTGGWSPWEYINPPMQIGIEYRTTERYLGKPVYVKVVDCGAVPSNAQKIISIGVSDPITKIRCDAFASTSSDVFTIPRKVNDTEVTATLASSANNIYVTSNTDTLGNYTVYVIAYYTKRND